MIDGDTLQSVAYTELGNPAYWRAIADLNGIDDPQRVTAGTTLLIPSVADAARGS
jgi:nucleoid-associated protein YgaU